MEILRKGNKMKDTTVKYHEDGSATISLDLEEGIVKALLKQGFRSLIDSNDTKVCDPIDPINAELKTYELSDEEFQMLLHLGFIDVLKSYKGL